MTNAEIIRYRLFNQQIAETKFTRPKQIVEWMVAMQAQEYAMAKWSVGLRLPGSTDEMVEKVLKTSGIDTFIPIHHNLQSAIAALQ